MMRIGRCLAAGVGLLVAASCGSAGNSTVQGQGQTLAQAPIPGQCLTVRADPGSRVLVFSYTQAFRHQSIPAGVAAVRALGEKYGFAVEETADPTRFTDANLAQYDALVFVSTTGDLFNEEQQAALQRYIRAGGGFVGVHGASDAEKDWPWYGDLVGAYFQRHPQVQPATIRVIDRTHLSTRCLPEAWTRTDEWYDLTRRPPAGTRILANLDETTYQGGQMGDPHPIAWYREFEGGRSWYTALGHTNESYSEPEFLDHLAGGILWALGKN